MGTDQVPIQHIGYCGYHIEVSAILIAGQWYPLFRILTQDFGQIHPWQVPAVYGADDANLALETAISMARELVDSRPPPPAPICWQS